MQESDTDWGPIMALMAHLYGFKPWDVARLSREQLQMYLEQSGNIRLMAALPQLQYAFSKYDAEGRQKLIDGAGQMPDPNSVDARAWRVFIRSYQTDAEEAEKAVAAESLPLSQAAAAALYDLLNTGELMRLPMGSVLWRTRLLPIWNRICATAEQGQGAALP